MVLSRLLRKKHLWAALVLARCTARAGADEAERIVQAFERLGAVVQSDDSRPNPPVTYSPPAKKPAAAYPNDPSADASAALLSICAGLLIGGLALILLLIRLWKTEKGQDGRQKVNVVVGKLLLCIVIGAVILLIGAPLT
jgi:hypothetical protein